MALSILKSSEEPSTTPTQQPLCELEMPAKRELDSQVIRGVSVAQNPKKSQKTHLNKKKAKKQETHTHERGKR
jgi:hypothetical protein